MTRAAMAAFAISLAAPAAMAQSTMAPSGSMAPMKTTTMTTKTVTKPMAATAGKLGASQKFTTVAAAQATCPSDTVVWSSFTSTHSFHLSTSKYFGKTKHGAYVCEQAATAAGYHQSKT
jgi:hypothetical protein